MTDDELIQLLDSLESDRVERKRNWAGGAPTAIAQAICAFANDLPRHEQPGVIFIGAEDDGAPARIQVTDQLLLTVADLKGDGRMLPPPSLVVERRHLKGADMVVVTVTPSDTPPVRFEGRVWIRIGPRRGIATAQDERILNEKRRYRDRTFDIRPLTSCPLHELNRHVFENEYLPRAVAPDVLEANGRSFEQRLAALGMIASIDDPTPTVVGMLTLGNTPRTWLPCAYVQFLRIRGTELTDPVVDEQEFDGTIDLTLRRLDDKLRATLANAVDFTSGTTTEIRRSAYPLVALQQIVRNAVMHRNYEGTNAPVRVYWFDDRIEITNPGGPYGMVNRQNFGRPGVSDYRNPNLAAVLKTLGFVQRFGVGIAQARQALVANGNPELEFVVEDAIVLATIRRAP
ncbi:MAG: putative DNA binding domain-containing protein [Rhodanobacteraceae bacterium]|nr:putative DNA binding domain-containing protein [Rhodanobacteraceae bacterium]